MNVLIVHAHPEQQSFCAAMCREAVAELQAAGHRVVVSDLYAQGFNPVASAADFGERRNAAYLTYALEQRHGVESGTLAPDIQAEIDKVRACDLLILSFPVFWFSVPAMLKGWIDRVLVSGVFYGGRRIFDRGGMRGKKAMLAFTLGGREHMFGPNGIHGDLEILLKPLIRGTLGYVGMSVLEPFAAYHVPYLSDAERAEIMRGWRSALATLDERRCLDVPSLNDYDETLSRKDAAHA